MILAGYLERNVPAGLIEPCAPKTLHAAVIPVYDENDQIYAALTSVKRALQHKVSSISVILVINEPADAPADAQKRNRELLESLKKNDGKYDGGLSVGSELFYINLLDKEIKPKFRTVGNARKTGFDGFLHQSDGKVTDKNRLFFSLDADTLVSENYFSAAIDFFTENPHAAGGVFDFEHRCTDDNKAVKKAVLRYEYYLRDYVNKLAGAHSAYSFWTIGSAFACRQTAYMSCGGMRRNAAGEDFYFLQALRKVGEVGLIPHAKVYPAGRISMRVPFGTGPAIARQLQGEELKLYNQKIFDLLKEFFTSCSQYSYKDVSSNILQYAPELLRQYLQAQNFDEIWQKIVKNTPRCREKLYEALQIYCDGFFILKFAHFLEEKYPVDFARTPLPPDEELPRAMALFRAERAL